MHGIDRVRHSFKRVLTTVLMPAIKPPPPPRCKPEKLVPVWPHLFHRLHQGCGQTATTYVAHWSQTGVTRNLTLRTIVLRVFLARRLIRCRTPHPLRPTCWTTAAYLARNHRLPNPPPPATLVATFHQRLSLCNTARRIDHRLQRSDAFNVTLLSLCSTARPIEHPLQPKAFRKLFGRQSMHRLPNASPPATACNDYKVTDRTRRF